MKAIKDYENYIQQNIHLNPMDASTSTPFSNGVPPCNDNS